jgi:translation initiation factor 2 alpha subunit (eIF-2alpha)
MDTPTMLSSSPLREFDSSPPNLSNPFLSRADGKHLGLTSCYSESDTVFESLDMTPEVRSELLSTIARRLTPKPVKVRSDLELTCYSYEGINGIKAALRAGEALSTEQVPIKIRLVAPPLYVMSTTSTDKNAAIELMEQALSKIGEEIEKYEGNINVAMRVSRTMIGTWRPAFDD